MMTQFTESPRAQNPGAWTWWAKERYRLRVMVPGGKITLVKEEVFERVGLESE